MFGEGGFFISKFFRDHNQLIVEGFQKIIWTGSSEIFSVTNEKVEGKFENYFFEIIGDGLKVEVLNSYMVAIFAKKFDYFTWKKSND